MQKNNHSEHSLMVSLFSKFIEWGNNHFTFSQWFFKKSNNIFKKLEIMTLLVIIFCFVILSCIHLFPFWFQIVICILLGQRILEFFIVYSRNFIFNRGRIFTQFENPQRRGEWIVTMFGLNVLQMILIFGIWYDVISNINPFAFSHPLHALTSVYFSFATFVTVGYGDIYPVSHLAKLASIGEMALTFYTLVIVVNGLISIHFNHCASDYKN